MQDGRLASIVVQWGSGKRQLSAAAANLNQQHYELPHPRVLGLEIMSRESRSESEKENALRDTAQSWTSIMGSTPGSFARTRLIFVPHRRCHWALRILHLADMPAISQGTPRMAPSGIGDCANELCLIRQYAKTLEAALPIGTDR